MIFPYFVHKNLNLVRGEYPTAVTVSGIHCRHVARFGEGHPHLEFGHSLCSLSCARQGVVLGLDEEKWCCLGVFHNVINHLIIWECFVYGENCCFYQHY